MSTPIERIIELFAWHVLCGGPIVVITRLFMALLALLLCAPSLANFQLTVALFALYPVDRKLEYADTKSKAFPGRKEGDGGKLCLTALWFVVTCPVLLIQYILYALTIILTVGVLKKHWQSIYRVEGMHHDLMIVDEQWTEPMPPSVAPFNPEKNCKISLKTYHGRWVCCGVDVHCKNHRLFVSDDDLKYMVLTTYPFHLSEEESSSRKMRRIESIARGVNMGKMALCSEHETAGFMEKKWLGADIDGTVLLKSEQIILSVEVVAREDGDTLIALKTKNGKCLSARTDHTLHWDDKEQLTDWELFEVVVHEVL